MMAYHGKGTSSFIHNNLDELSKMVVLALKKAMDLALENCALQWLDEPTENLACVFRNQLVHRTMLIETS